MKHGKYILPLLLIPALFLPSGIILAQGNDDYKNVQQMRDFPVPDERLWRMPCHDDLTFDPATNDTKKYELVGYMKEKGPAARLEFIKDCCDFHREYNKYAWCRSNFVFDYDGNTLTLASAQYNILEALKHFVTVEEHLIDDTWRSKPGTASYDIHSRSELMHAIANNNLDMVKFLLGEEDGPGGNKTRYSNPKRKAPHENPALHLKYDARDFARWHKGRIDDKIIELVEEVWKKSPPHSYGERNGRNRDEHFFQKVTYAQNIPPQSDADARVSQIVSVMNDVVKDFNMKELMEYISNLGGKS